MFEQTSGPWSARTIGRDSKFPGFPGSVRPGTSEDAWTGIAAPCDAYRATCLQFRLPPMMRPAAARGERVHDEAEPRTSSTLAQHLTECHRHGIAPVPMATLPCSFISSPTNRTYGTTRANVLTPQRSHLRFRLCVMLARTESRRISRRQFSLGALAVLSGAGTAPLSGSCAAVTGVLLLEELNYRQQPPGSFRP